MVNSLDIEDRQVLIDVDGSSGGAHYELHILLAKIRDTVWVTVDSDLVIAVEDLLGKILIPLARDSPLPIDGRPFLLPHALTEAQVNGLRVRANQLVDIHTGAVEWRFSDPALSRFNTSLSTAELADPWTLIAGADDLVTAAVWTKFNKFVAEQMKTEGQLREQNRLMRLEAETNRERKNNKVKKGVE